MNKGRVFAAAMVITALALMPSWIGAFSLTRGQATPLSSSTDILSVNSIYDQTFITEAFVGEGTLDYTLNIPVNRVQYDILNVVADNLMSWTLYYDVTTGPKIIGATTPDSYIDSSGVQHSLGGQDYATLFNDGYGVYTYNTGALWTIDYQPNRVVFTGSAGAPGLPIDAAVGVTDVGSTLSTFGILWDRSVPVGHDAAMARAVGENEPFVGVVWGPSNQVCVPEPAGFLAFACAVPALLGLTRRRS